MMDIALPAAPLAIYLVVWVVAALDLFIPILPTGALMIAGGALTAQGELAPLFLIAAGTLGAWIGDLGGYRLGRRLARGFAHLAPRRTQPDRPAWHRHFARHTVLSLLAARCLPAGRTIAAVTAGRQRFPQRGYALAALLAETVWAVTTVTLGRLGGWFIPPTALLAVTLVGLAVTALTPVILRLHHPKPSSTIRES
ncbi:VTT domain-containing protein [Acrocarpospora macrocephala]|uniref:Membrane protein n=1 Tax=Acrocarpospora macrocephala TaxID=150177 RepID=A0A5M3X154_9ACTN|nr:VTT domain-containing protein [Acrocarpospora macrocephala]GES12038.1 membrane protein [Acrocarpospora macrocephala]